MPSKIFAISDIHGNYDELMALYKQLPINPEKDQLVICGDHIDRGPKTKQVIEQLMEWKKKYPHWQFLYGNHEDLMLDALVYGGKIYGSYDLWWMQGGRETYKSYTDALDATVYEKAIMQVKDVIPVEHLEFLAQLPVWYESEDYYFVHGGLVPGKKPEYEDMQALIWARDLFIDSDYNWGKKVIFGHTPNDKPYKWGAPGAKRWDPIVLPNKIGIDTVSARNKLTAVELPSEKFYFQPKI